MYAKHAQSKSHEMDELKKKEVSSTHCSLMISTTTSKTRRLCDRTSGGTRCSGPTIRSARSFQRIGSAAAEHPRSTKHATTRKPSARTLSMSVPTLW